MPKGVEHQTTGVVVLGAQKCRSHRCRKALSTRAWISGGKRHPCPCRSHRCRKAVSTGELAAGVPAVLDMCRSHRCRKALSTGSPPEPGTHLASAEVIDAERR